MVLISILNSEASSGSVEAEDQARYCTETSVVADSVDASAVIHRNFEDFEMLLVVINESEHQKELAFSVHTPWQGVAIDGNCLGYRGVGHLVVETETAGHAGVEAEEIYGSL